MTTAAGLELVNDVAIATAATKTETKNGDGMKHIKQRFGQLSFNLEGACTCWHTYHRRTTVNLCVELI